MSTENERITENLIRDTLRNLGYVNPETYTIVEEQKSQIDEVIKSLKNASKTGKGGKGSPEFIISSKLFLDFLIIIECKASVKHHESQNKDRPAEFAVDGILHYAKHLSKSYNIIAIGASGQTKSELNISTFLWPKGAITFKDLTNEFHKKVEEIIPFDDYVRLSSFDPQVEKNREDDLMEFSRELHDFMRNHAKLTESEKPLLVSGTLLALRNTIFAKTFDMYKPEDLQKKWIDIIKEEIDKADIPKAKKQNMVQPYSSIAVHPELGSSTTKYPKSVLHELIKRLNEKVWPFVSIYHDFDIVGKFYGEFLKYTGGDKKSLGIVLTPRHITELFASLANLSVVTKISDTGEKKVISSKVLDICAGTGGFLISSMQNMIKQSITNEERTHIKKECLVGVEQQPNMYALAASNMILRGDGKANLYQGSCFDTAILKEVKRHKCNIGMLNPPYSQGDADLHELVFVEQLLECITPGGTGIAIVPMSCAISANSLKEKILKHHTLDAVMSMPGDLFYPVGVVTCIMMFTVGTPHTVSNKKTWFGYWKNDGFLKTKSKGRIDVNNNWTDIKNRWIEQFKNREIHPGESVMEYVTAKDEWCAEAYMETDYSCISQKDFEESLKNYAIFKILGTPLMSVLDEESTKEEGYNNVKSK